MRTVWLALSLVLLPSSSEPPVLEWTSPVGCPEHEAVQRLLDPELAELSPVERAGVATTAEVERVAGDRWRLRVRVRMAHGEVRRELVLDSCAASAEAVALVVGLALAPSEDGQSNPAAAYKCPDVLEVAPPQCVPSNSAAPVELEARSAVPQPALREAPQRENALQGSFQLAGGAGFGWLGPVSGQVMTAVSLLWPHARLRLRMDHAFARRVDVQSTRAGGNISMTTSGVEAGPVLALGDFEVLATGIVHAGLMRAQGVGVQRAEVRWVPWASAGLGLGGAWRANPHWSLAVAAELGFALVRHTFVLDAGRVLRTKTAGGRIWAGVEYRFP